MQREIDDVMAFFKVPRDTSLLKESSIPLACEFTGIERLTYNMITKRKLKTRATLAALSAKTKVLSLRDYQVIKERPERAGKRRLMRKRDS